MRRKVTDNNEPYPREVERGFSSESVREPGNQWTIDIGDGVNETQTYQEM